MKKITKLIAVSLTCILAACSENKTVETETAPATTEIKVVKVETKAPENSTEIIIGKDGAKVETKNGANGTKIEVKK
ncbi:MAG: hypothetical protein H0W73_17170 [Bacteroidetes bacterium]|nr:hypothetical protein [Bacteroidota bacterium]